MTGNFLIEGDVLDPCETDLITQVVDIRHGKRPAGEGWRMLTGNMHSNLWARVAYRYEITDGPDGEVELA